MKITKKFLIAALILTMIVSVSGCGSSGNPGQASTQTSTTEQSEEATTQKSENELTEREQRLLDALITMTKEDFYEPSKVRILEIPVYDGDGVFKHDPDPSRDYYASGSDEKTTANEYAVVRLQGENKVGGTLNHYYAICISERKLLTETSYSKDYQTEDYCNYSLKKGEYINLGDDYKTIETPIGRDEEINWYSDDGSKYFDIGKINKAFAAYWKDMGFE